MNCIQIKSLEELVGKTVESAAQTNDPIYCMTEFVVRFTDGSFLYSVAEADEFGEDVRLRIDRAPATLESRFAAGLVTQEYYDHIKSQCDVVAKSLRHAEYLKLKAEFEGGPA